MLQGKEEFGGMKECVKTALYNFWLTKVNWLY